MKHSVTPVLMLMFITSICSAADKLELKSEQDRINYSVGYQIGGDFKKQGVELNPEALVQGIQDALAGRADLIPQEEMRASLITLKKRIAADQEKVKTAAARKSRTEERAFLAENARKEGVKTLPSGLQYKVIVEGAGKKPTLKDTVTVNYRSTLIDGTEFDSTYRHNEPRTFHLDKAIPGLKEALPLMKEGAKWQLFVPEDLAFGERGPLADRVVIFEIELVSVKSVP